MKLKEQSFSFFLAHRILSQISGDTIIKCLIREWPVMRKGRDFRDKPVIDIKSGKLLGYVKSFKTGEHREIDGLYFTAPQNGMFLIPFACIISLGRDAVLISGWPDNAEMISDERETENSCLRVITGTGESLGTVEDIIIEENDGSITGYEVSDGLLMDVVMGRRIIPASDIVAYGEDVVIIGDTLLE